MSILLMSKYPHRDRYLKIHIFQDLKDKMVLLGGPRQVGKTTLALSLLAGINKPKIDNHLPESYMNWDDPGGRRRIKAQDWPASERLVILDEIHKYARWRNFIKGSYDTQKNLHSFLITGSARLDYYRKGGDSLLGRYYYYRLHPFSLPELNYEKGTIDALLKFGGFPEPLMKQNDRTLRRWQLQRMERVIREDLRDLENVREISLIEQLAEALPERVGAPLSIKNLSQDLEVDFKTVKHWIAILENLYFAYRISPFGAPKIRAVKKEQKLYLWDWSTIPSSGARFENLVASHLLKYCHFMEDTEGYKMELRYLRDTDKREVDFVILKDRKPIFAVECKTGEKQLSAHIPYFLARTNIPYFYQVHLGTLHRKPMEGVEILPFEKFCKDRSLV